MSTKKTKKTPETPHPFLELSTGNLPEELQNNDSLIKIGMHPDSKNFFNNPEEVIAIVGLGETRKYFGKNWLVHNASIGVNDIYRYYETDYLVCMDPTPEGRLPQTIKGYNDHRQDAYDVIMKSTPKKLFSDLDYWDRHPTFEKINTIAHYNEMRGNIIAIENHAFLAFSNNSPYTATVLAWSRFKAKKIVLYGIDFNTHNHTRFADMMNVILFHYFKLYHFFKSKGVELVTYSNESALSTVLPYLYDADAEILETYNKRIRKDFVTEDMLTELVNRCKNEPEARKLLIWEEIKKNAHEQFMQK